MKWEVDDDVFITCINAQETYKEKVTAITNDNIYCNEWVFNRLTKYSRKVPYHYYVVKINLGL